LREIWFDVKEYEEDNKAKNMLGTIIVFLLVEKEYICSWIIRKIW